MIVLLSKNKVEKCVLLEEEGQEVQTDHLHQRLSAYLQRYTAKQNGAKAIRTTYITMIKILKKVRVFVGFFKILTFLIRDFCIVPLCFRFNM